MKHGLFILIVFISLSALANSNDCSRRFADVTGPGIRLAKSIVGNGEEKEMVHRGLQYLAGLNVSGAKKAALWEAMGHVIESRSKQRSPKGQSAWVSKGYQGSRGEFLFQGNGGHVLVITPNGRLYTRAKESRLIKDGWVVDYDSYVTVQQKADALTH